MEKKKLNTFFISCCNHPNSKVKFNSITYKILKNIFYYYDVNYDVKFMTKHS